MAKAKTLSRRKKFLENIPKLHLKKGLKLAKHDPFKRLLDEKLIAQAFWECLKNNDPEGAMEIINAHLNALNKAHFSKEASIPRSTLYHNMRRKNPTLRTIAKMIHCCVES